MKYELQLDTIQHKRNDQMKGKLLTSTIDYMFYLLSIRFVLISTDGVSKATRNIT